MKDRNLILTGGTGGLGTKVTQLTLNLTSTFLVCKYALKKMKDNDYGRIVTVSSRAALEPAGQMAAYSASKAGVIALTRSIAE